MDQQQFQTAVLERLDAMNERMDVSDANLQLLTTDYQNFKTAVIGHFETLEKRMDGMQTDIHALNLHAEVTRATMETIHMKIDATNSRIDIVEDKIDTLHENIRDLKTDVHNLRSSIDRVQKYTEVDRDRISDIYNARYEVTMKWGWEWALVSILITISSVGITQTFTILWLS